MNKYELQAVLSKFSDRPDDIDLSKGEIIIQVQDQLITFKTQQRQGQIHIIEDDVSMVAEQWITKRLAKLSLLAHRIIDYVEDIDSFVAPSGKLVAQLEDNPKDEEVDVDDAAKKVLSLLDARSGIDTFVLYLTSDAGEGKTTIINTQARIQAQKYLDGKTDWLLLPIPLGGMSFLRLDHVVVGTIANKYRFRGLYFESFIELVKLGVLVPAFDGFEEMFVEGASGEAVSSLSNLIRNLGSTGGVLVAARKAYFEIRNFETQGRLLDGLPDDADVSFARLKINRWEGRQFKAYWESRGLEHAEDVYNNLRMNLGDESHPLLTRAVLVKKLAEIAKDQDRFDTLIRKIDGSSVTYFADLIDSIIEREIEKKWVNRAEESVRTPLITLSQHHHLLAQIAMEMAHESAGVIKKESLEVVAEMYCDSEKMPTDIRRQVLARIGDHPLIIKPEKSSNFFSFDHDEFREFFLGEALGWQILDGDEVELRFLLRNMPLTKTVVSSYRNILKEVSVNYEEIFHKLEKISLEESSATYAHENCGRLMFRAVQDGGISGVTMSKITLPLNVFSDAVFNDVSFSECYFSSGFIDEGELVNCSFDNCRFESIDMAENVIIKNTILNSCEVFSYVMDGCDTPLFSPKGIGKKLQERGFIIKGDERDDNNGNISCDDDKILLLTRGLRAFSRSTGVNDNIFLRRLGTQGHQFIDEILPEAEKVGLLELVEFKGRGHHKRYRLNVPMSTVQKFLKSSEGSYETFLESIRNLK